MREEIKIIDWFCRFWLMGGPYSCRECTRYIWPHQCYLDKGADLPKNNRYICEKCGE